MRPSRDTAVGAFMDIDTRLSPAEATAAILHQATSDNPVPIPGAFERRVGRIQPTATAVPEPAMARVALSPIAHAPGGRLHRLSTGSNAPMTFPYRGVASISLVVLLFLVFSEPGVNAGVAAALLGTSVLAVMLLVVAARLSRKGLVDKA